MFESKYIETNGIKLHCLTKGKGDLMLFLHGFPEFSYSWRSQLEEFSKSHFVVAPDLRGYNLSDKPKEKSAYVMTEFIEDVKGLIKGLGYEKCTLVVHDWGGMIGWYFAHTYPEMVEKLVVLNIPHPACFQNGLWNWEQLKKSWYIFFFQLPVLPERFLSKRNFEAFDKMFSKFPKEDIQKYKVAFSQEGAVTAAINYYRNVFGEMRKKRTWTKLKIPTLMIWGEKDIALGKELTFGTEKFVEDIKIKYIPDAGHWVQQEKPELVNRYMHEFVD